VVTIASYREDRLFPRIERAVAAILERGKVVAPVDVLVRVIDFCDGGVFPIIGGFGLDRNSSPAAVPGSVPV
jgi:hypothetical protein